MAEENENISIKGYLLFKLDRTFAILGIIGLGVWALHLATTESIQLAVACVGVLGGYIGGRSGK